MKAGMQKIKRSCNTFEMEGARLSVTEEQSMQSEEEGDPAQEDAADEEIRDDNISEKNL